MSRRVGWKGLGLGVALLMLLAVPALVVASCQAGDVGLVNGRLRDCPSSPNCVCSDEDPPSIEPLAFSGDADRAFASLVEFLAGEPRVELVSVEAEYLHAVFRTRLLRFRDDVEFRLDRAAGVIHVRSASRVGYSDMGANRARIEALRERWGASG